MTPIRIFVISNFPLLRQGIVSSLEADPMQFRITGTANTLDETVKVMSSEASEIVLLDIDDKQDQTTLFSQSDTLHKFSHAKILLMGNSKDKWVDSIASSEHFVGFVSRDVTSKELVDALKIIHAGNAQQENDRIYIRQCNKPRLPRVHMVVPVRLGNAYGESRDFSSKGIYFEIKGSNFEVGNEISFELDLALPNGDAILTCRGQIVRKDINGEMVGLGIEISESTTRPVKLRHLANGNR